MKTSIMSYVAASALALAADVPLSRLPRYERIGG